MMRLPKDGEPIGSNDEIRKSTFFTSRASLLISHLVDDMTL
jgi:hypothetical protein